MKGCMELFPELVTSKLYYEDMARSQGFKFIAGIDEAGRGPLAGPVIAAAVVLPENYNLPGLNDSKQLSEKQRNNLFPLIFQQAKAVGVGVSRANEIDRINVLQATLKSMTRAVKRMSVRPDYLLIDGINYIPVEIEQMTIKKGDSLSHSIAAASVVAKVVRDRIMHVYDKLFPEYGFARHKGYGSQQHRGAIALHGPCACHRLTFSGVREHSQEFDPANRESVTEKALGFDHDGSF